MAFPWEDKSDSIPSVLSLFYMSQRKKGYVRSVSNSYAYVTPEGSTSRYQFGRADMRSGKFSQISVGDYVSFEVPSGSSRATNIRMLMDKKN